MPLGLSLELPMTYHRTSQFSYASGILLSYISRLKVICVEHWGSLPLLACIPSADNHVQTELGIGKL